MARNFRSLVVSILALWRGLSQKELGAAAGMPQKNISQLLTRGAIGDEMLAKLVKAMKCRPAEVSIVTGCVEALEALDAGGELTPEERSEVELEVVEMTQLIRRLLTQAARHSRSVPGLDECPQPASLEPTRWRAGILLSLLEDLTADQRLAVVRVCRELQSWALMERACEESVAETSRNLERAASLTVLARAIAERVQGPEGWRQRVQGYAAAHAANLLRVAGDLKGAETLFAEAKALWHAGSDPDHVLDPGRLFDLEASLRRDQRRFQEALSLLDKARGVSRCPGHTVISKAFTLEVMGEYERAVETLLEAEPLVERQDDPRLLYMLRFNLAVNYCHVGRHGEAAKLVQWVSGVAQDLEDEIFLSRVVWLNGRIGAGLGRTVEALKLLDQARLEFAERKMWYDVALALLEEAVLLLEQSRAADTKVLATSLAAVFDSRGVHREALAALRLFREAVEREEATAEQARRVLRYLFRARHDQGLRFES